VTTKISSLVHTCDEDVFMTITFKIASVMETGLVTTAGTLFGLDL